MVKKGNPTKVLKELPAGFTIREERILDSKTGQIKESKIKIYQGKKAMPGDWKNTKAAEDFFYLREKEEVAKRSKA